MTEHVSHKSWSHNTITGGQVVLGDNYVTYSNQSDPYRAQRDQLLKSLRFEEINLRHNNIIQSHDRTFEWILNDPSSSAFAQWLKDGSNIFWIEGKAGSGKSTLMKYISNAEQTLWLLRQWAESHRVRILKFFFWLSGTLPQRSLKGCLASLLFQILSGNHSAIDALCEEEPSCPSYLSLNDWSVEALKKCLLRAVKDDSTFLAIFIDGLDEFDQDDDSIMLLDMINELSEQHHVKICLSSRPMTSFQARVNIGQRIVLQHLTKKDIMQYTEDVMQKEILRIQDFHLHQSDVKMLISAITEKADGVFIWVRLALKTLLTGLSSRDTIATLIQRVDVLPKGMEDLYLDMCMRNHDDYVVYREEAQKIFAYARFLPMTIFDLVVAMDESIQEWYLLKLEPLPASQLISACEKLLRELPKLCFGFLEIKEGGLPEADLRDPERTSNLLYTDQDSDNFGGLINEVAISKEIRQGYRPTRFPRHEIAKMHLISPYYHKKVVFAHRTVHDFILGTAEGKRLLQDGAITSEEFARKKAICDIGSMIESLRPIVSENFKNVLGGLGFVCYDLVLNYSQRLVEKLHCQQFKFNWEFYTSWRQGTRALSTLPHDIYGRVFWYGSMPCLRTILNSLDAPPSPYYLGHFVVAATGWKSSAHYLLPLYLYIFQQEVDLFTPQAAHYLAYPGNRIAIRTPLSAFINAFPDLLGSLSPSDSGKIIKLTNTLFKRLLQDTSPGECLLEVCIVDLQYGATRRLPALCDLFQTADICRLLIRTTKEDAKFLAFHTIKHRVQRYFKLNTPFDAQMIQCFDQREDTARRRIELCIAKVSHSLTAFKVSRTQSDNILAGWRQHRQSEEMMAKFRAGLINRPSTTENSHGRNIIHQCIRDLRNDPSLQTGSPGELLSEVGFFEDVDSYIVPLEPTKHITEDNWRTEGALRDYYRQLKPHQAEA